MLTAVTSTRIFCNNRCPAQPPKKENRLMLASARDCIGLGCRPCKRCKPLHVDEGPSWLSSVLQLVEDLTASSDQISAKQLKSFSTSKDSVARWFSTKHGFTFDAYLRMRRLARELGTTWLDTKSRNCIGRKSLFEALLKSKAPALARNKQLNTILVNRILTPLGPMVVCATDDGVVLLEFADRRMLETQIVRIAKLFMAQFRIGVNDAMRQLVSEFDEYFAGSRRDFDVPLVNDGTEFQNKVWKQLVNIPVGKTSTYQKLATKIRKPKAVRAVGRANGDNRLTILIPCHRVVGSDGSLTGYGGGLDRKHWLLQHEREMVG